MKEETMPEQQENVSVSQLKEIIQDLRRERSDLIQGVINLLGKYGADEIILQ